MGSGVWVLAGPGDFLREDFRSRSFSVVRVEEPQSVRGSVAEEHHRLTTGAGAVGGFSAFELQAQTLWQVASMETRVVVIHLAVFLENRGRQSCAHGPGS